MSETKASSQPGQAQHENCEYDPGHTDLLNVGDTSRQGIIASASELAAFPGLESESETITRGALLAHDPKGFYMTEATTEEKKV